MERMYALAKSMYDDLGAACSLVCDKAATWVVNPGVSRDQSDIEAAYRKDPRGAAAMYECIPMAAENAFFEFKDKITEAVDGKREPCATVEYYDEVRPTDTGQAYYVSLRVSGFIKQEGKAYFLAGDGGHKGDAFTLCVMHVDDQAAAFPWLCPKCGAKPNLRASGRYTLMPFNERRIIKRETNVRCGVCMAAAPPVSGRIAADKPVLVQGWYEAETPDSFVIRGDNGSQFNIGTIYEDLLIRVEPVPATRPDEHDKLVSFLSVQAACNDIIKNMGVIQTRFDQWQTIQMRETLLHSGCGDVDELPMTAPEQYRRARLTKNLLYEGGIVLLPNVIRDREWRQLRLINGTKIDHPEGGSKDLYDAEAMCIWMAANYKDANISMSF